MNELTDFLIAKTTDGLLAWPDQVKAAETFALSIGQVERAALENEILPARYQRHRNMISCRQQLELFRSTVAVIGCGGLGGYIIEELARLGVGRIRAIDSDMFEEHNLNRQILSTPNDLGALKTRAAEDRVKKINPAVTIETVQSFLSKENGRDILSGVDVVADAVDNIRTRLDLEDICEELGIHLVHGAIAGWYGHICSVYPGDDTIQKIYRYWEDGQGAEQHLGNPAFTPPVIASLQVAEVCKILIGAGSALLKRALFINLLTMEVEEIKMS